MNAKRKEQAWAISTARGQLALFALIGATLLVAILAAHLWPHDADRVLRTSIDRRSSAFKDPAPLCEDMGVVRRREDSVANETLVTIVDSREGDGIPNASVELWDDGTVVRHETGRFGQARIRLFPLKTYQIVASHPDYGTSTQVVVSGAHGNSSEVIIRLSRNRLFSCQVLGTEDGPVPNARVEVEGYSAWPANSTGAYREKVYTRRGVTDKAGAYCLEIPPEIEIFDVRILAQTYLPLSMFGLRVDAQRTHIFSMVSGASLLLFTESSSPHARENFFVGPRIDVRLKGGPQDRELLSAYTLGQFRTYFGAMPAEVWTVEPGVYSLEILLRGRAVFERRDLLINGNTVVVVPELAIPLETARVKVVDESGAPLRATVSLQSELGIPMKCQITNDSGICSVDMGGNGEAQVMVQSMGFLPKFETITPSDQIRVVSLGRAEMGRVGFRVVGGGASSFSVAINAIGVADDDQNRVIQVRSDEPGIEIWHDFQAGKWAATLSGGKNNVTRYFQVVQREDTMVEFDLHSADAGDARSKLGCLTFAGQAGTAERHVCHLRFSGDASLGKTEWIDVQWLGSGPGDERRIGALSPGIFELQNMRAGLYGAKGRFGRILFVVSGDSDIHVGLDRMSRLLLPQMANRSWEWLRSYSTNALDNRVVHEAIPEYVAEVGWVLEFRNCPTLLCVPRIPLYQWVFCPDGPTEESLVASNAGLASRVLSLEFEGRRTGAWCDFYVKDQRAKPFAQVLGSNLFVGSAYCPMRGMEVVQRQHQSIVGILRLGRDTYEGTVEFGHGDASIVLARKTQ